MAPEILPGPKRKVVFKPLYFRGKLAVKLREGIRYIVDCLTPVVISPQLPIHFRPSKSPFITIIFGPTLEGVLEVPQLGPGACERQCRGPP